MSSFDRRKFLISSASLGALASCGFTPAYAPGGRAAALRGRVEIDVPSDRESYTLVNRLTDTFGTPSDPLYRLSYKVATAQNQIGITRDQEITRYHITGQVSYTLLDLASGQALMSDKTSGFTGYSATGTAIDSLTASRDAYARLMVILADQMVSQIIAKTKR
ncbi:LPS assembly lipoprotein LptE [Celeribacter neptunius]|uniref:LPS-assembly lipoprotein n=1 Tax=Celeribacter neptunius TaxID=588602 RepID=A0A1I3S4E6_9RHOB|nr:LPS assembly lipoprotein LptE [Celeribacter neptunius]SFJ52441.1 LPS-assembly lipoprotein [Celeribacter neptunius]